MRIIRPDGTIVECSSTEYNEIQKVITAEKLDMKKVYGFRKNPPVPIKIPKKNWNKYRNKWSKAEDRIVMTADTKSACKLLPHRTKSAIWTRKCNIRAIEKHKHGRCVRSDDKRIKMMRFVSHTARTLRINNPKLTRFDAQKRAMNMYRDRYVKEQ